MRTFGIFLNYGIFVCAILLVFLLVFEPFLDIPGIVTWLGRWHPVLLHFPIAMIFVVIIQFWRKDQFFEYYLGVTTLMTFITSITGLLLSLEGSEKGDLITRHQWLGVSVTYLLGLWYWFSGYLQGNKVLAGGMNLTLLLLVINTGHFGGMITHGAQFLSFSTEPESQVAAIPDDPNVYQHVIQPILNQKCVSCHNQNKSKGKLILANHQSLLTGGESGSALDFDNLEQSLLLKRVTLPMDDDEHMPPPQETQLTDEELVLLSDWILAGASSDMVFSQLENSAQSKQIIQSRLDRLQSNTWDRLPEISDKEIADLASNYISIFRLYQKSNAVQVIMYPNKGFQPGDVSTLKPLKDNIVELSLNGLSLSARDLEFVGQFSNLEKLDLGRTTIEQGALAKLQSLQQLKELRIYDMKSVEATISDIGHLASIQCVYAYNSGFSDEALANFKEQNPSAELLTVADQATGFKSVLPAPTIKDKLYFIDRPIKLMLEHPLKGIDIFYTLDGKIPDENQIKYSSGIDVSADTHIKFFASKEGWQSSPIDSFKIFWSGSIPDDIALPNAPNKKYPGTGPDMLFDLKKGPLSHNDSSWMAYREASFIVECQWEEPQNISQITLSTYLNTYSYIFSPEHIKIVGGIDRATAKRLFQSSPPKLSKDYGSRYEYYQCDLGGTSVSYLSIQVTPLQKIPVWHRGKGEPGWFFIDEVVIN